MSLRATPIQRSATLPDGRTAIVRVGVPADSYIPRSQLDTVAVDLLIDEQVAATVNTILNADQEREASELARTIAAGLESGELEPTASAIEPLADELR